MSNVKMVASTVERRIWRHSDNMVRIGSKIRELRLKMFFSMLFVQEKSTFYMQTRCSYLCFEKRKELVNIS